VRKLLILLCLSVVAAGCGGDEPASTTSASSAPPTTETVTDPYVPPVPAPDTTAGPATTAASPTTTAPATTAAPDTEATNPTITIAGFAFSGPSTVSVGDTIEVVNNDGVPHTWTSEEDGVFNLSLAGGTSGTFTFQEPGEYRYFCAIHPSMTGTITVEG
jgi:plastocyanin